MCDRDLPEYAPVWHGVASNAKALQLELTRADVDDLVSCALSMFGYHPGSFSEAYIKRDEFTEQVSANEEFEQLKDRVSKYLVELSGAVSEV
jgi:hypothetical protein